MHAFIGLTAYAGICFFIGVLVTAPIVKQKQSLLLNLSVISIASFYTSFFLGVLAYKFQINLQVPIIVIALSGFVVLCFHTIHKTEIEKKDLIALICTLILLLLVTPSPPSVFLSFDGVASWNRWAQEIASFDYHPYDTAYPVFFPVLWSIIYNAANNVELEYLSSLLLIVPVIFCVLSIALLFLYKKNILGYLIGTLLLLLLLASEKFSYSITNGYMDAPVTLLLFAGFIFYGLFIIKKEDNSPMNNTVVILFLCSAMLFSIAGATKQSGAAGLIFFNVTNLIYIFKEKIRNNKMLLVAGIFVSLIPIAVFLELFFSSNSNAAVLANLEHLQNLTKRNGVIKEKYYPLLVTIAIYLLISTYIHVKFWKNKFSKMGILTCLILITGSAFYYDCCSYHQRNGWWLFPILVFNFFCCVQVIQTWPRVSTKLFNLKTVFSDNKITHLYKKTIILDKKVLTILCGLLICIIIYNGYSYLSISPSKAKTLVGNRGGVEVVDKVIDLVNNSDKSCTVIYAKNRLLYFNPKILKFATRVELKVGIYELENSDVSKIMIGGQVQSIANLLKDEKYVNNIKCLTVYAHGKYILEENGFADFENLIADGLITDHGSYVYSINARD